MSVKFASSGDQPLNGEIERTIDTDILVDLLRGVKASREYLRLFESGERRGSLSAVVVTELVAGKRTRDLNIARRVERLIALFFVVPVTFDIARKAGELVRDYGLSLPDALIAATALLRGAILVTHNVEHFQRIPNLRLEVPY